MGVANDTYADICFEDARQLLDQTHDVDVLTRYDGAYRLLMRVLNHQTVESALVFSGPFAKLDYVARKTECPNELLRRVNAFRCRGVGKGKDDPVALEEHWLYDMRALCLSFPCACRSSRPSACYLPENGASGNGCRLHQGCCHTY